MKAVHFISAILLGLVLCGTGSLANLVQFSSGGGGPPPSYTGDGDVQAFVIWFSSTFAYSSATRGTKNVKLCNGGVCADVNSDASTGQVPNAPTINGSACNNSTHICKVDTVYNKGTGGANDDFTQSTDANRPIWVVDGYATGVPCMSFSRSSNLFLASNGITSDAVPQPFLATAVSKFNAGTRGKIWGASNTQLQRGNTANKATTYALGGAALDVTLTDGTWGDTNGIFNGASSYLRANSNTASGVDIGSAGSSPFQYLGAYDGSGTDPFDGMICTFGVAGSVSSTSVADAVSTNQHSSGQYNF